MFNFLALIANDAEVGLLDPLLKPIRLWVRTCHNLPKRLKLVNATACGLTAIMMSLVVIGGIPYDRLWDWGVKERPKQNLMGAVMDRMKKLDNGKGSDNLEDAVKDFAGKQNLDADNNNIEKPKPALPQQRADCVILGYQLDRDRRISSLVLGTASRSRLVFAGRVTPSLSDDEAEELLESLHAITVNKPFIRIPVENMLWVQPKLTCRITYTEQFKDGRFRGLQWEKLLGAIDLKTAR